MRDIPTSPRIIAIKRKNRARIIRIVILYFILFASIVTAISYFSSNKHITISQFTISGTHILNQENIESLIRNDIKGKYVYLFSKSNSFIYPKQKIYNDLLLNFPRIDSLSVYRDNLKTLHVEITERTGSFLYCGEKIPENKNDVGENCYFVNNDGYIFDKAPYFSGNVYFKYYLTLPDEYKNPLAKQMLDVDKFHKLMRFVDEVTSLGFKPIYLLVAKDGVNHLYLDHSINGTIPEIIFKDEASLEILNENFRAAMKKNEFASEINSKYNTLLYIDLRFNNKVLYKFQ